jgi:hypothetical protein
MTSLVKEDSVKVSSGTQAFWTATEDWALFAMDFIAGEGG